jgi:hypothetical protein
MPLKVYKLNRFEVTYVMIAFELFSDCVIKGLEEPLYTMQRIVMRELYSNYMVLIQKRFQRIYSVTLPLGSSLSRRESSGSSHHGKGAAKQIILI